MSNNKNNNFDTSQVLSEKDYRLMNNLKNLKKDIFSYINMDNFINKVIEIVDKSDIIDFKNERARKFIDKRRPVFIFTINKDDSMSKYNKKKFSGEEDEAKFFSDVLFDEVITYITTFINDSLKTEEGQEILSKETFEDLEEDEDLKNLNKNSVISTLYAIRLEKDAKNNVVLEILM